MWHGVREWGNDRRVTRASALGGARARARTLNSATATAATAAARPAPRHSPAVCAAPSRPRGATRSGGRGTRHLTRRSDDMARPAALLVVRRRCRPSGRVPCPPRFYEYCTVL